MKRSGAIICCGCSVVVIICVIIFPELLFFLGAIGAGFVFMMGVNKREPQRTESYIEDYL